MNRKASYFTLFLGGMAVGRVFSELLHGCCCLWKLECIWIRCTYSKKKTPAFPKDLSQKFTTVIYLRKSNLSGIQKKLHKKRISLATGTRVKGRYSGKIKCRFRRRRRTDKWRVWLEVCVVSYSVVPPSRALGALKAYWSAGHLLLLVPLSRTQSKSHRSSSVYRLPPFI